MTRLIEGAFVDAEPVDDLRGELEAARLEAAEARRSARAAHAEATAANAAMAELRRQLSPLYRALQMVFGELEAVPESEPAARPSPLAEPSHGMDARTSAVWDAWKQKLGAGPARIIEALQLHRELGVAQLKITCQQATSTVNNNISKMRQAGLIDKNSNGKYSLKSL